MDNAFDGFWKWWLWIYPLIWLALRLIAVGNRRRAAGWAALGAGVAGLFWQIIFFEGSPITRAWATDAPTHVLSTYKLWGFLALVNKMAL